MAKSGDGKAVLREKCFLSQTMLRDVQHFAARENFDESRRFFDRLERHVFKLESNDINRPRELLHRVQIFVFGARFKVGDLSGRRVGFGRKRMNAITHLAGFDGEHSP